MNTGAFAADLKKLIREPILMLFMVVPFIAVIAVKFMLLVGMPILFSYTGVDFSPYFGYIEAFMFMLSPGMLGAVAAFMMIDERDGGIYELMSVTPVGFIGYITNRLVMPFILSFTYTVAAYFILDIYSISLFHLVVIGVLCSLQSIVTCLFLFSLADDKVKGLTLAKALDSLMLTAGADLLGIGWLSIVCAFLPFYWVTRIAMHPDEIFAPAAWFICQYCLGIYSCGVYVKAKVIIPDRISKGRRIILRPDFSSRKQPIFL